MNEKYEYNGLIYCEDDLPDEIYTYGGNLHDLYCDLLRNKKVEEFKGYYLKGVVCNGGFYRDYKELIKEEYENLGIKVLKGYE